MIFLGDTQHGRGCSVCLKQGLPTARDMGEVLGSQRPRLSPLTLVSRSLGAMGAGEACGLRWGPAA